MSLYDLFKLVAHYRRIFLVIVIGCSLLSVGIALVFPSSKYEATATLTSADPTASVATTTLMSMVSPIATQAAEEASQTVSVSARVGSGVDAQVIFFSASGSSAQECVDAVNNAASLTAKRAKETFDDLDDQYAAEQKDKNSGLIEKFDADDSIAHLLIEGVLANHDYSHCSFVVVEATQAVDGSTGLAKMLVLGLIGGLFASLCVVVFANMVKSPIKSRNEVESLGSPEVLLDASEGLDGDRLWANIQFAYGRVPQSIALVPVSAGDAEPVAQCLVNAAPRLGISAVQRKMVCLKSCDNEEAEEARIAACDSLLRSVEAACEANCSDATIVVVREWDDTARLLVNTLRELRLAKANLIGTVLLRQKCSRQ